MKKLTPLIKRLNSQKKAYRVFSPENKNPFVRFLKRLGRKITFWFMNIFGENQNRFNTTVSNTFKTVDSELNSINKKTNDNKKRLDEATKKLNSVSKKTNTLAEKVQKNEKSFNSKLKKSETTLNSLNNKLIENEAAFNKKLSEKEADVDSAINDLRWDIKVLSGSYKSDLGNVASYFQSKIAANTNEINAKFDSTVAEMNERINSNAEEMNAKIESNTKDLQSGMTALEKRLTELLEKKFTEATSLTDSYMRKISPERRRNAPYSDRFDISADLCRDTYNKIGNDLSDETYDKLMAQYKTDAKKLISRCRAVAKDKTIAVICKVFKSGQRIEAVRNEAYELYQLLKDTCAYNVVFISIEPKMDKVQAEGDVVYVPEKGAAKHIAAYNPSLCIFCESSLTIARTDNYSLLNFRSIFKLSAQNPVFAIEDKLIDELTHLNDFGFHKHLVQSEKAYSLMVEKGFREPVISYPLIRSDKLRPRLRVFDKNKFTVGFASSPMYNDQQEQRGMALLSEVVTAMPEVNFEILWRYETATIPEALENAKNCIIHKGAYDMNTFYSEIDCVIIPYQSYDKNHGCSLSALEGMKNGIPVACTDISGVSEVVRYCGMGEVCGANTKEMTAAIEKIRNGYNVYTNPVNKQRLDSRLDNSQLIDMIEEFMEEKLDAAPVTLAQWDKALKEKGKYLVKGHLKMKEYYQQQEVAQKYTATRFTTKALKFFDSVERQNIGLILEEKFGGKKPTILDIACGDGRITSECIKHGSCTSVDASPAMLSIVTDRFKEAANPPTVRICDIIADEVAEKYNAVTCFRYIRHFEYAIRKHLYKKIYKILSDDGIFVFDVPNLDFELKRKKQNGWHNYNIYDVFWTKEDIINELRRHGFEAKYILPVEQEIKLDGSDKTKLMTACWTVGAVKIKKGD